MWEEEARIGNKGIIPSGQSKRGARIDTRRQETMRDGAVERRLIGDVEKERRGSS